MGTWVDITDPANWQRQIVNYTGSSGSDDGFFDWPVHACGSNNSNATNSSSSTDVWTWDGTKWNPPTGLGFSVLKYIGAGAFTDIRITAVLRSNFTVDDGGYGTMSGEVNYEPLGPVPPATLGTYTTGTVFTLALGTNQPFPGNAALYAFSAFARYQPDGGSALCGPSFGPLIFGVDADITMIEGFTGNGFWTDLLGCEEDA